MKNTQAFVVPIIAIGGWASSLHAEQWTKSDSASWSTASSWADNVAGAPAPPGSAGNTYTNVRLNLQGGTTIYSASEGTQTYDVSASGGETRGLVMSSGSAASSTLTMTGGELIFVQDGATDAVLVQNNNASTATINLDGGKITINETDSNGDTKVLFGLTGGGGGGIVNVNSGGVFTAHLFDLGNAGANSGTLNLNAGGTIIANRIFDNATGTGTSSFTANGGTLQVRSNAAGVNLIDSTINTATIQAGGLTVDTAGFNASINKGLVGVGGFTKVGAGTLTIANGASSYSGNVDINAGTVIISGGGSATTSGLGAASSARTVTVATGGALNFTINDVFGGENVARPALVIHGSLNSTRYNAIGDLTLNGGTLFQSATDSGNFQGYQFSGSVTVGGAAMSTISTGNGKANHLAANTTFTVANATPGTDLMVSAPLTNRANNAGAGALTKEGAGSMMLGTANSYSGGTTVNAGTLIAGHASAFGTGAVTLNGGALVTDSVTVGNNVSILGSSAIAGSYSGTVNSGSEAARTIDTTGGFSVSTLMGQGTFSGGLVTVTGSHNPGLSPGTQTFGSGLSYADLASVNMEITSDGSMFDLVNVGNALAIGNGVSLNLYLLGDADYAASFWDTNRNFTLFATDGFTGNFDTVNLSGLNSDPAEGQWSVGWIGNDLVASWVVPEPSAALLGGLGVIVLLRRRR